MYIHPANFFADESFRVDPQACFVIMPYSQPWSRGVYRRIRELVNGLGFHCRRADEFFDRVVLADIWRRLNEAAFVIADLTGENPNVYYELGIAHALGKETIAIIQQGSALPFDQRGFRVLEYAYVGTEVLGLDPHLADWIDSLAYTSSPQVLLRRGLIQEFNEWKRSHPHVDLSNADLSDLNLSGVDLSSAILRGALLQRTIVSSATLMDIRLTSADLREAVLDRSRMMRGQVSEANLIDASAKGTDLSHATIIRSDLTGLTAPECVLRGANLSESTIMQCDLRGADLREGIWFRVRLDGANLEGARVSGLTVESATWRRYRRIFEMAVDAAEIVVERD